MCTHIYLVVNILSLNSAEPYHAVGIMEVWAFLPKNITPYFQLGDIGYKPIN